YGLSYTRFTYSGLTLDQTRITAQQKLNLQLQVKNTGKFAGDEVVQVYIKPLQPIRTRALKELRAVQRVTLRKGEARTLHFTLQPDKDMLIYDEQKKSYRVDPGRYEIQIGSASNDIRVQQMIDVIAP
ncbi:MAG TPA: fibronectin type III-like domain-contianing protein, partial [Cellvibrio sp.]